MSAAVAVAVDPAAKRKAAALRMRELQAAAEEARRGTWHEYDSLPDLLKGSALALEMDSVEVELFLHTDVRWLERARQHRADHLIAAESQPYRSAILAILDEALALLRGLA